MTEEISSMNRDKTTHPDDVIVQSRKDLIHKNQKQVQETTKGKSKAMMVKTAKHALTVLVYNVVLPGTALAQAYTSGHQPLELWDAEGQANAPAWIGIWLNILLAVFALGLLFVWRHIEARWVVGGFLATIPTTILLTQVLGVAPLSGLFALMHVVFWSPALYVLLTRRPFLGERSLYGLWSGAITAVIIFSFIFDIPDSAIYLDHILGLGLVS